MTIEVSAVADRASDPYAFAVVVEAMQGDCAERDPNDPLPTATEVADTVFLARPHGHTVVLAARRNGAPAGFAWAATHSAPGDAEQLSDVELFVLASHRGHGVASALIAEMVDALQALGQTTLVAYTLDGVEPDQAGAICQRYGMTARQRERCSRLAVAEVDTAMMASWESAATEAAPGYQIHHWQGTVPEPLIEAWCQAKSAMADVPLDQLEFTRPTVTPEGVRSQDAALAVSGWLSYRTLVVGPDGDAAGLSILELHPERSQLGHQEDTAVVAAHRGKRIGRWLKAATLSYVQAQHRDLAVIETYNAEDNPWMLAINEAMGFRPHHGYTAYQAPLSVIAEQVDGSRSGNGESHPR